MYIHTVTVFTASTDSILSEFLIGIKAHAKASGFLAGGGYDVIDTYKYFRVS